MKKYTTLCFKEYTLSVFVFLLISMQSFSQSQKNSDASIQSARVEKIILKAYGIKSNDVLIKYQNFLNGLKGIAIAGHTLENEYLLIEIDTKQLQVIDVLQPLKDSGFVFEYLFDNPSLQKQQELFANDPLIK